METVVQFLTVDRCLEIVGLCIGLLYLYWEYQANPKMWFANIAMPTISFWVYYRAGLYADFAMNIYYFIIAIYGYIVWKGLGEKKGRKNEKRKELPITHIPSKILITCTIIFLGIYAAIFCWLKFYTDSNVPVFDAFTTALSIVAMWMLARKYIEQWIAWILVDGVTVGLCIYKDRPFYAVLYALYTCIAVFGYRKWKKLM